MEAPLQKTRRTFLGVVVSSHIAQAAAGRLPTYSSERKRYADPTTEFEVWRLTEPAYSSYLPPVHNRPVARRGGFFVYASDRSGSLQVTRMDLRSGDSEALSGCVALRPYTICLAPDERSVYYADGRAVMQLMIGSRRARKLLETAGGEITQVQVSQDGRYVFAVEYGGGSSLLRRIPAGGGTASVVFQTSGRILDPLCDPRRTLLLYRKEDGSLWSVHTNGQQNRRLNTAPGRVLRAHFSPDGHAALYLVASPDPTRPTAIREHVLDSGADQQVAVTSRFVDFSPNANASVFAGVSGSIAQPTILMLVRSVKRELTLCEHRSSNPESVHAQFSPNSQRLLFQSDRHGKPAIYMMNVERLVERTETE